MLRSSSILRYMKTKCVIFPHHLFTIDQVKLADEVVVFEDPVCYGERSGDVPSVVLEFNKLRLAFMRASVRRYKSYLESHKVQVTLVDVDTL